MKIVIWVGLALYSLLMWCCMKVASDSDDAMEELWNGN